MLHQAELDSLVVTEDQVNAELANRINYFVTGVFGSIEKLEEYYKKPIELIKEDFYPLIEKSIKTKMMQDQITAGLKATPKEIRKFYADAPKDSLPYISSQVEVSRLQIKPVVSDTQNQIEIDLLNKLRSEIQEDESLFATYALFYSDDEGSKDKGGELGAVFRGTMVPEFEAEIFRLDEGQISKPFKSDFGYHIVQLLERRGDQYSSRHILRIPVPAIEETKDAEALIDSLGAEIDQGTITFEAAARIFSTDDETKHSGGKIFNRQTGSSKFNIDDLDGQLLPIVNALKVGQVSDKELIQERKKVTSYQLIKLNAFTDPHQANLKDDYQLIQQMTLGAKRQKVVMDWVSRKTKTSYVWVDDKFKDCVFQNPWIQ